MSPGPVHWYAVVSYSPRCTASVYGYPADYVDEVAREMGCAPSGPSDSVTLVIGPYPWMACVKEDY